MRTLQAGSDALQHVTTLRLDPGTVILGKKYLEVRMETVTEILGNQ